MDIKENVFLDKLTTFKTGGPARWYVEAKSISDIEKGVQFAKDKNVPLLVLGGGSNVLISDQGFLGVVIKMELRGIDVEEEGERVFIEASAGEVWDGVVSFAVRRGWWGLQNLSGIPGSVGAAPIQNIGAYGAEFRDVCVGVYAYDTLEQKHLFFTADECALGYRDSIFKKEDGKRYVVTKVRLALSRHGEPSISYKDLQNYFGDAKPSLAEVREAVLAIRASKLPDYKVFGTAGSFFKNPIVSTEKYNELHKKYPDLPGFQVGDKYKIPAGYLLDKICGLKGKKFGPVEVYEKQALVVVNSGGATSSEIIHVVEIMEGGVKEKTGIILEREVNVI